MDVKLIVVGGRHAGKEIPAPGPEFLIGRGEECQLRPQSNMVSRKHCAILVEEGAVRVRDFQSRNGTFVNGQRVQGEAPLRGGDHLKIGPLEFEVRVDVPVGGKKKPKVHSIQEAAARSAQNKSGADDADISNWLEEGEDNEQPAQAARGDDTYAGTGSATAVGGPQADEPGKRAVDPDAAAILGPSKHAKPKAESSRSAAADVLNQMFGKMPSR